MTFTPKSDFLQIMLERGFVADCTDCDGLDAALCKGGLPAYIGFDATASTSKKVKKVVDAGSNRHYINNCSRDETLC